MKKKQITKLFAVMAMAASPAAANTPDPWAVSASASPLSPEETSAVMSAMIELGFAAIARPAPAPVATPVAARPRTTPSGAPACGNVATRAPRPRECAVRGPAILADVPAPAPTTAAMATVASTPAAAIKPTTQGAK